MSFPSFLLPSPACGRGAGGEGKSMARVFIPALLRELTNGLGQVQVQGATVGEVIDNLESMYPGIKARLTEEGRLRPNLALVVDGHISRLKLRHKVSDSSEIHFMPALSGG